MTVVLNIVLLSLAGLSLLVAVAFILKGLGARSSIHRQAYSVGQVEARRSSLVYWIRAAFFFLLALIFLGVFAVRPLLSGREAAQEDAPPVATLPTQTIPVSATVSAPVLATTAPVTPSPTSPPTTPTPEATAAPTATSAPQTATVSSGVGVWLRGAPSTSGEQLEWLLDGTVVTLLPVQQTADDLLWQQVRTAAGVEGWVARDFLTVEEAAP